MDKNRYSLRHKDTSDTCETASNSFTNTASVSKNHPPNADVVVREQTRLSTTKTPVPAHYHHHHHHRSPWGIYGNTRISSHTYRRRTKHARARGPPQLWTECASAAAAAAKNASYGLWRRRRWPFISNRYTIYIDARFENVCIREVILKRNLMESLKFLYVANKRGTDKTNLCLEEREKHFPQIKSVLNFCFFFFCEKLKTSEDRHITTRKFTHFPTQNMRDRITSMSPVI